LLFNYVPFEQAPGWQAIFNMRGVLDVIGPLQCVDMDRLRALCPLGVYTPPKAAPRFKPGQRVKVASGPFADARGVFDVAVGDDDARVLIHSFGRMVSIGFELGNLVAA
jgi:transcription antitermination factor NusG